MRSLLGVTATAMLLLVACTDNDQPGPTPLPLPEPQFLVSDPVPPGGGVSTAQAFVSALPATLPGATRATIRNPRRRVQASILVTNGGFDPIAIVAASGDTLQVDLETQATGTRSYRILVPDSQAPVVVRSTPTQNEQGIQLRVTPTVIFSEPMDWASIPGSIVLERDGVPVAGHAVTPDSANAMRVTFVADAPLDPSATYRINIATTAQDLDGDNLASPLTLRFSTTSQALPDTTPPTVAIVGPAEGAVMATDFPRICLSAADDRGTVSILGDVIRDNDVDQTTYRFSVETLEGDWCISLPLGSAGTYRVTATATDPAGNATESAARTFMLATPTSDPRIVVNSFTVLELTTTVPDQFVYAPQLVVSDMAGGTGLEILGFELLDIPGVTNLPGDVFRRFWGQPTPVSAGAELQLFGVLYWEYEAEFGPGRATGSPATARLTYRDSAGHLYMTSLSGAIVPGAWPVSSGTACQHWYRAYMGFSSGSSCTGGSFAITPSGPRPGHSR